MLFALEAAHAALFVLLAAAAGYVLACGISGRRDRWLACSVAACAIELVILAFSHWRCPLTTLAERLGAKDGSVSRLFLPHAATRFVFPAFGAVFALGLTLIAAGGIRKKLR